MMRLLKSCERSFIHRGFDGHYPTLNGYSHRLKICFFCRVNDKAHRRANSKRSAAFWRVRVERNEASYSPSPTGSFVDVPKNPRP